jgi:tetratricopeptide (TPR) repeat protein
MQRRFKAASLVVALVAFSLALVGCGQFNKLKAKTAFKDANLLYQQQDYKKAAEKYEIVVQNDPDLGSAYFYLANSYDNLFKPSRKGEAANDEYLKKAIENYRKCADKEKDPKLKKLSLEYLVAAYGPDKLADPGQAVPLIEEMIRIDPTEPTNYFVLSKMYEDAGNYEVAEQTLLKAKEMRPNDSNTYMQLAAYYNRQGEFEKTMVALKERADKEPTNPEAFYTIAAYYWEKAYRDFRLKESDKLSYIGLGLEAADKALAINPDYMDAVKSRELLLRSEALVIKDPGKQAGFLKEAKELSDKYNALRIKKAGGATTAPAAKPTK